MSAISGIDRNYALKAQQAECGTSAGQYIPPTNRQVLAQKKQLLADELGRVDDALSALDAHPELEEFIETLARASR